jgi:hypothetical protein
MSNQEGEGPFLEQRAYSYQRLPDTKGEIEAPEYIDIAHLITGGETLTVEFKSDRKYAPAHKIYAQIRTAATNIVSSGASDSRRSRQPHPPCFRQH